MEDDFLKNLGLLGFVTRMKRISDAMLHDGRRLYKQIGMDIEPNWYVIFKLLQNYEALTVTEISQKIGFAHPSVISIVNKMIKADYLEEKRDSADSRKRLLVLTPKAKAKLPDFEKVWEAGTAGVKNMFADIDALEFLSKIEEKVSAKGFRARALEEMVLQDEVEISLYKPELAAEFASLNYEWIEQYFKVEPHDREILDHPQESILDTGGQIFFASVKGRTAGTVALINEGQKGFELAKMAVTASYRGLKIGDKLMKSCIEYARGIGIKRIFLLSNTKLIPAIRLYRKFGFKETPLDPEIPYERTDIQMELILEKNK